MNKDQVELSLIHHYLLRLISNLYRGMILEYEEKVEIELFYDFYSLRFKL